MSSAVDPGNPPAPVVFGLAGEGLSREERAFFAGADPLGFILFGRNCRSPEQVGALVRSLKDCVGRDAPVLIDQEGGRVQRLRPPHWTDTPAARVFGDLFFENPDAGRIALTAAMETLARELAALGIAVDCAPVLDVSFPETHDAIGTRSYSAHADVVEALCGLVCDVFLKNGVTPVIKHLPGQGRAALDSHYDLPAVKASLEEMRASDFAPCRALSARPDAARIWGMVSHIVYEAVDRDRPASCSASVIGGLIRQEIGFEGLLLSDDLCMGALAKFGDAGDRAALALASGCDIALHCNGKMDEMALVAARLQKMTREAAARYNRSVSTPMA